MKSGKSSITVAIAGLILFMASTVWALPLTLSHGTKIIAIDGDTDGNVTIDLLNAGGTSSYTYGYFLNGSSTFSPIGLVGVSTFQGGDVIDFALYDGVSTYYTLSGDTANPAYSVQMEFANQVTVGSPQQPAGWMDPYYYNVNMTWSLPTSVNTNALALNLIDNGNDGVAPVPEPASILLLGTGLVALGLFGRKRS